MVGLLLSLPHGCLFIKYSALFTTHKHAQTCTNHPQITVSRLPVCQWLAGITLEPWQVICANSPTCQPRTWQAASCGSASSINGLADLFLEVESTVQRFKLRGGSFNFRLISTLSCKFKWFQRWCHICIQKWLEHPTVQGATKICCPKLVQGPAFRIKHLDMCFCAEFTELCRCAIKFEQTRRFYIWTCLDLRNGGHCK